MRERGFPKVGMASAKAQWQDHSQNPKKASVVGGSKEESSGRQGPTGYGGGVMAYNLVLQATGRTFTFTQIIGEPRKGFKRGSMSFDLSFMRIPLVVL